MDWWLLCRRAHLTGSWRAQKRFSELVERLNIVLIVMLRTGCCTRSNSQSSKVGANWGWTTVCQADYFVFAILFLHPPLWPQVVYFLRILLWTFWLLLLFACSCSRAKQRKPVVYVSSVISSADCLKRETLCRQIVLVDFTELSLPSLTHSHPVILLKKKEAPKSGIIMFRNLIKT